MSKKTDHQTGIRTKWLTADKHILGQLHAKFHEEIITCREEVLEHPVITESKNMVNNDPVVRMYLTEMIEQIPKNPKYDEHRLQNIDHMFRLLNSVLTKAPDYNDTLLVGTPFSAILIWTMGTRSGFAAYRNEKINAMLKKLLNVWCQFLNSKDSLYVLNDSSSGWMCEAAKKLLHIEDYHYKADEKYWGFKSWNDFFTRKLKKGVRPIAELKNHKIVVGACDSTIYKISKNVKRYSKFWIKTQPYSLSDMLDNQYVDKFIDGTVFQAFLSPFKYHRWHSPVSGKIVKAYVKEGLYFSQADSEREDPTDQDASEGYLVHVQTRAIFFIDCDDPGIGLVCVMPTGMVEISSCIIGSKMKPGYHVDKGEELGYFQFGGSTHCIIFQKGVIKNFTQTEGDIKVGQEIAVAN
ncbi:MAG: phosphatidylserine decarboxylase family protein [bacterium]|nr:phosphatidylserine decarboxylase family protein [bacterium]